VILVDSSVWIDYFRGAETPQVARLDSLLGSSRLAVGDLIVTEVLQGLRSEREFNRVRKTLGDFTLIELAGREIAIQAARNFRILRKLGVTVRKTIDTIIATRCIESELELLHSDRDFDAFAVHLGLKVVHQHT
jgi:predicted nucleic acid-binding protein